MSSTFSREISMCNTFSRGNATVCRILFQGKHGVQYLIKGNDDVLQ